MMGRLFLSEGIALNFTGGIVANFTAVGVLHFLLQAKNLTAKPAGRDGAITTMYIFNAY